jgi:CubicO group peptidase (beta-lactamase class C family)
MGLDDLAQEYLPSSVKLPTKDGKQITILDLVNHQSGLPHDPDDVDMNNPDPQSDYTVQQLYDYLSRVQLEFTPGENVGYSNTGVALLANIMSLKSGLSYEQYLSQRILNPIGLNDTGVYWTKTQESMVDPGYTTGGEPNPLWQWHQPTFVPVGAIHSTANDMLKLAKAVFTPESSTLSEIAFGKTAERIGWGPIIQHGGGTYGFISYFYVDRNKQTALIVWGNCANLMLLQLGLEVKKVLEGVPPQLIELPQLVSLSESELKPYLGKYRINKISHGWAMKIDSILELKLENGKLVSQSVDLKKANTTWCPEADGDFYIKQEAYHVTFIKDSTGKIVGMISKPNLMGINFSARKLDNSGNEY